MTAKQFCEVAVFILGHSKNFARDYVAFKLHFFNNYQEGLITSTRFGADFFAAILAGEKIKAAPGEKLGEYDENFNRLLDKIE